jgi:hypothetical protein
MVMEREERIGINRGLPTMVMEIEERIGINRGLPTMYAQMLLFI